MINLGADLHSIDQNSFTPFIHVLIGFINSCDLPAPSFELSIKIGLKCWLSSLKSCGINLYEYGKREEELHERGLVRNKMKFTRWIRRTAKLASFTYGSSPGGWNIKLKYQYSDPNKTSGQDSGQVEEMPGGWIEN